MSTTFAHQKTPTIAPQILLDCQQWGWQKVASSTVNNLDDLATYLALPVSELRARCSANDFALRVPLPFVARMQTGHADDPLLLQVLPQSQENVVVTGYVKDPIEELAANPCPGIIHKYAGRVLLTTTTVCPINCRYCFRRHFPYTENRLTPSTWHTALQYIKADSSIKEVILSGGEPLMLNDNTFAKLLDEIEAIEHVQLIRIHSRFPIVTPQRLTETLCARLIQSRCQVCLVLHCNHANEIDQYVVSALQPLVNSPVTLLNQTVLLRGINDSSTVLENLSFCLYKAGVLPYYLHALDPVSGAAHFNVPDHEAIALAQSLIDHLPGYLVPTLVRELAGEAAKTRLGRR